MSDAALSKAAEWPGLTTLSSAQEFLEKNKILINEINKNHEALTAESLRRNAVLIKELNSNVGRVVELYKELALQLQPDSDTTDGAGAADGTGQQSMLHPSIGTPQQAS